MLLASVCRVCLSNNRLEIIANTQLQSIFEKLTSHQLITGDGRPESLCYMCHQLLQKCCKFAALSHRAENILSQLLCSGSELTQNDLSKTRAAIQNDTPLAMAVCKTTFVSIPSEDESSKVCIKVEPEAIKCEEKTETEDLPNNISGFKSCNENDGMEAEPILEVFIPGPKIKQKPGNLFISEKSDMKDPELQIKNNKTTEKELKEMTEPKPTSDITKTKAKLTYDCFKCHKTYKQKAYLKRHVRTHTGEKPYACKICTHTFTDSVILKQHLKTHSGEAPYICHICSKPFNQKPHLLEHVRTHTGEKPYVCETCSQTFAHRGSLKRHMRTHSGEKPYICQKCSRQFSQISNLQKHIRTCKVDKNTHCVKCSHQLTPGSQFY